MFTFAVGFQHEMMESFPLGSSNPSCSFFPRYQPGCSWGPPGRKSIVQQTKSLWISECVWTLPLVFQGMSCSDGDNSKLISYVSGMMCVLTGWVWSWTGHSIPKTISAKQTVESKRTVAHEHFPLLSALSYKTRWCVMMPRQNWLFNSIPGWSDSKTSNLVLAQLI